MKHLSVIIALTIGIPFIANAEEIAKTSFYYDIQWGNLVIGHIDGSLERKDNSIKLKVKSESEGAISLLYNYKSDLFSSSYKQDDIWRANSYVENSAIKSQKYYSKVLWNKKNNKPDYKIDPPLDLEKVHNVRQSTLKNVIDPITAMIKIIEKVNKNKPCDTTLNIFDGRRRYTLLSRELKKQYLINDRPRSYKGETAVCGIKFIPVGGHWIDSKWDPKNDKFSDIKVFFGTAANGSYLPVRLNLNKWFGTVTVRLLENN
jgi:hypothetical protein